MIQVPFEGPLSATLAIVGEAPGQQEEQVGRPFIGYAGQKLVSLLNACGILRQQVRLMNVSRVRPPGNDFGCFWEDKKQTEPTELLQAEIQNLKAELRRMPNLRVILALGRQPTYILTNRDGIGKWRGSPLKIETIAPDPIVVPAYHPAFLLRQPDYTPICLIDFKKAVRFLTSSPRQETKKFNVYPSRNDVAVFVSEALASPDPLIVDIETPYGWIIRIGLMFKPNEAISIPFGNVETKKKEGNEDLWPLIRELLAKKPVIGQNFGSYDRFWLEKPPHNCKNIELTFDTMTAQHIILPGLPKALKPLSLGVLTSIYTDEIFHKDEAKNKADRNVTDEEYGIYNCKDLDTTMQVYLQQIKQPNFQRRKATFDFEMNVLNRTIRDIMARGVRIDIPYKEELRERAQIECEYLSLKLAEETGETLNLASPTQLKDLLYRKLGLKGGVKQSTDEESIKILQVKYPGNKVLDLILKFRNVSTLLKGILSAELDPDGRMRSSYRQATDTGRLQAAKNPYGRGYAFLTVDRRPMIRKMFLPDEGKIWVHRDLSQAEAWAIYYLAGAESMLKLMRQGKKPHQMLAAWSTGKRYEDVGKGTIEYELGKRGVHGFNYLMGIRTFVRTCRLELGIDTTEREAKKISRIYHSKVPELRIWDKKIQYLLQTNRMTLTTSFGRERQFFGRGPNDYDVLRKAVAFLPQSTIGDLLNKIILKWYDIHTCGELLFPVHDETNTQCWPEEKEQHLKELDQAFNYPFDIGGYKNVVIPWDTTIMKNWGEEA